MEKYTDLKKEIELLKDRNKRVETDKAWETSWTRKVILSLLTYLAIGIFLNAIYIESPWLNAIVPTVGFLLSTLTIPVIKNLWKKYIYKS